MWQEDVDYYVINGIYLIIVLVISMIFWKNLASEYLNSKGVKQIPEEILEQIKPMTMSESAALFQRVFGNALSLALNSPRCVSNPHSLASA